MKNTNAPCHSAQAGDMSCQKSSPHSIHSESATDTKDAEQQSQNSQNRNSTLSDQSTAVCEGSTTASQQPSLTILLAFIALCLSIFLVALDTVLIPTALPTIALSFHVRDYLYAWIGSAYLLANAASVPFWGKLSDIFGRKYVILTANLIFLAGSIICGVSTNATMLIAGRVVQGFGGGGVVVLVHVCVSDLFPIRYVHVLSPDRSRQYATSYSMRHTRTGNGRLY
jgi:Na+/melibiose symporter-like transporter